MRPHNTMSNAKVILQISAFLDVRYISLTVRGTLSNMATLVTPESHPDIRFLLPCILENSNTDKRGNRNGVPLHQLIPSGAATRGLGAVP